MTTAERKHEATFMMPLSLNTRVDEVDLTLANGNIDIVLDFSSCHFISVDGLEWVEELLLRAQSLNSELRLKSIKPSIYKVFKVARIDSVLQACGSVSPSGPVC